MDEVPVLMVSSPVNKYYLLDLGPKTSVIAALQRAAGSVRQLRVNPDQRHRDVGLDGYVQAVLDMLETVREITGSPRVHVLGALRWRPRRAGRRGLPRGDRAGGRTGQPRPLGGGRGLRRRREFSALLDAKMAAPSPLRLQARLLPAADTAAGFAWIRPEDGVWMNVVNNYLLGRRPARSELLSWAADDTHLTAGSAAT